MNIDQIKIFHISDLHFHPEDWMYMYNKNKEKNFGVSPEGFKHQKNWKSIWNNTVGINDLVINSGDTINIKNYNKAKVILNEMENVNGKHLIINGNHDPWFKPSQIHFDYTNTIPITESWYTFKNLFIIGSKGESIYKKKYQSKTPYYKILSERLKCAKEIMDFNNFIRILVLHFPPETKRMIDLIKKYNINIVLFGHQHGNNNSIVYKNKIYFIQSLAENTNYEPVHISLLKYKPTQNKFVLDKRMINMLKKEGENEN